MKRSDYVTASEIQEYVYCKRAWWLGLQGRLAATKEMEAGTVAHEEMARSVQSYNKEKIVLVIIIGMALFLVLLYILANFLMNL